MALIECPECKKQISNQAQSCPNCGRPMSATGKQVDNRTMTNRRFGGCLFLLGLFFIFCGIIWSQDALVGLGIFTMVIGFAMFLVYRREV